MKTPLIYPFAASRATGNDAGDFLLAGPDWKGETPPAIKKVFLPTTQFSLNHSDQPQDAHP